MWWEDKTTLTNAEVVSLRVQLGDGPEFWDVVTERDLAFEYSLNPKMADYMLELSVMDMRGLTKNEAAENPVAACHTKPVPYYALDSLDQLCGPFGLAYIKDRRTLTLVGRKRYAKFVTEIINSIFTAVHSWSTLMPAPLERTKKEETARQWKALLEAEAEAAATHYKIEIIKYEYATHYHDRVAPLKIMHKVAELQPDLRDWEDKSSEIVMLSKTGGLRLGGAIPIKS